MAEDGPFGPLDSSGNPIFRPPVQSDEFFAAPPDITVIAVGKATSIAVIPLAEEDNAVDLDWLMVGDGLCLYGRREDLKKALTAGLLEIKIAEQHVAPEEAGSWRERFDEVFESYSHNTNERGL